MGVVMSRDHVYHLIDTERHYQNLKWHIPTSGQQDHSWEEWFTYVEDYVREAQHEMSRKPKQEADVLAAHCMRKVAALAVAAIENLGAPPRDFTAFVPPKQRYRSPSYVGSRESEAQRMYRELLREEEKADLADARGTVKTLLEQHNVMLEGLDKRIRDLELGSRMIADDV